MDRLERCQRIGGCQLEEVCNQKQKLIQSLEEENRELTREVNIKIGGIKFLQSEIERKDEIIQKHRLENYKLINKIESLKNKEPGDIIS